MNKLKKFLFSLALIERKSLNKILSVPTQQRIRHIINDSDSVEGQRFDKMLFALITLSVLVVVVETLPSVKISYYLYFYILEWIFSILFLIEYLLRIYASRKPVGYITSFWGIVDLMAFLPTFASGFIFGSQHFLILRIFRLARIFRIFKLGQFVSEGGVVVQALKASKNKIFVFISFLFFISVLVGSAMYSLEGSTNPNFKSIPDGIYWAVVTISTVGYGDVAPITALGRTLAMIIMILSYALIAIPIGIVTAEIGNRVAKMREGNYTSCPKCNEVNHLVNAKFCHNCGEELVKEN